MTQRGANFYLATERPSPRLLQLIAAATNNAPWLIGLYVLAAFVSGIAVAMATGLATWVWR